MVCRRTQSCLQPGFPPTRMNGLAGRMGQRTGHRCHGGFFPPFLPPAVRDVEKPLWEWDEPAHAQLDASPPRSSRAGFPKRALAWEPPGVEGMVTSPLARRCPLGQKGSVCPCQERFGGHKSNQGGHRGAEKSLWPCQMLFLASVLSQPWGSPPPPPSRN